MGKFLIRLVLLSLVLALFTVVRAADDPSLIAPKLPPELLARLGITAEQYTELKEAAARGDPRARELIGLCRDIMASNEEAAASDPLQGIFGQGSQSGTPFDNSPGLIAGSSSGGSRSNLTLQGVRNNASWPVPNQLVKPVAAAKPGPLLPHASSHPTMLTAIVDKRPWPVIRVERTSPVVQREKKEKRIWSTPIYSAERAERFAPAWVEVKDLDVSGIRITTNETITATAYCTMTLTSAVELKGAFAAVLVFDADFIERGQGWPHTAYLVHDLPDLPKGKPVAVKFSCSAFYNGGSWYCLPLIFARGGAEVSTNWAAQAKKYFTTLEKNLHAAALRDYRAQNTGDHDAAPFQRVNPILPETPASAVKVPVAATLAIDESGQVTAVKITTPLDPIRTEALDDALRCWLFLPKLKAGQPMPAQVQVTLEL